MSFDERLETWAFTSRDRNFVDGIIGSTGVIRFGIRDEDWMRQVAPDTMTLIIKGERHCLAAVAQALTDLGRRAEVAADRTFRTRRHVGCGGA